MSDLTAVWNLIKALLLMAFIAGGTGTLARMRHEAMADAKSALSQRTMSYGKWNRQLLKGDRR